MEDLSKLIESARQAFAEATQPAALEDAKAKFLGKSGTLTTMMKGLRDLAADQRKAAGAEINAAKRAVEEALNARREALAQAALEKKLAEEAIDVTLPGRTSPAGGIHPVIRTWMRIEEIFRSIGFDVASGPEIENDWYTFTALNNPLNHPARSMQDTFYVDMKDEKGLLLPLRPHTSPMQVRYSRTHKPPIKVIAPGRTYRVDSDATHSPMFHQVEGLWLGENISFADLKGVYSMFLRRFFETDDLIVRFRPSYFPFTEPSVEVDMMFTTGSRKGKWLEISGAGEVHPTVVRNYGLDPEQYCGFAFGSGLERLTMLRYGIDDLRLFFEGDLRFLRQFNE
ncbi:MAG: phenylalanine--tRNA ligase subunit alpha [Sutterella sp.]|jgi:phenylalanyl-tRNA synthetase alpha chain|uniref:Phenylalanine--tRNA ligase alpha subunit n=1 Tax=Mesosutterella multiformis TaxID=2259133 RepID=A0A388SC18_9BURK|nr:MULTISPECIES: phenylalanine--tRNA ligase subunit alpha [Sutterellaceae]MBS5811341.1 phenylalanine--tRNA ligase subunit alpha [Sutterella sp.]RGU78419.1 phenylalanine--tRNA ligase subunit alpha [Sutterella sp. AF15-45LB]RGU79796.1 phenylalanine--tRNA ligase subunit alpha [Sutterella sp. AF15-44LB]RHH07833.1 phenylalanine--tRNA ligase subunit alpha [Sutterella sp. AM18-8-1]CDE52184.1 phenylalanine--tRNA ligase alpha subunit [Sutterella sp. CAG:351]